MFTEISFCGSGRGTPKEEEFTVESGTVVVGRPAPGNPAALQVAGVDLEKGRVFVSEDLVSPVDLASTAPSELLRNLKGQEVCSVDSPFPRTDSGYPFAVSMIAGRFVNAVLLPETVIWGLFMVPPPPPPPPPEGDVRIDAAFNGSLFFTTKDRVYSATITNTGTFKQTGQSDPASDILKAIRAIATGKPCPQTPNIQLSVHFNVFVSCLDRQKGDDGVKDGWQLTLDFTLKGSVSVGGRFCSLANAALGF